MSTNNYCWGPNSILPKSKNVLEMDYYLSSFQMVHGHLTTRILSATQKTNFSGIQIPTVFTVQKWATAKMNKTEKKFFTDISFVESFFKCSLLVWQQISLMSFYQSGNNWAKFLISFKSIFWSDCLQLLKVTLVLSFCLLIFIDLTSS